MFVKLQTAFNKSDLGGFHAILMPKLGIGSAWNQEDTGLSLVPFFESFPQPIGTIFVRRVYIVRPPPIRFQTVKCWVWRTRVKIKSEFGVQGLIKGFWCLPILASTREVDTHGLWGNGKIIVSRQMAMTIKAIHSIGCRRRRPKFSRKNSQAQPIWQQDTWRR